MSYYRNGQYPGFRSGVAAAWRRKQHRGAGRGKRETPVTSREPLARNKDLQAVEAVLLAADEPVSPRKLAKMTGAADTGEVRRRVALLKGLLDRGSSAFQVEEIASGYQLLTQPALREWLVRLHQIEDDLQLSGPTLETLAIVAYRQPICRADIEAIRGVQVGEIMKQLMDKGLVRIAGKDEQSLGRPYLYGTTPRFLRAFGLRNLHELPLVELLTMPESPQTPPASETRESTEAGNVDGSETAENSDVMTDPESEVSDVAAANRDQDAT